MGDPREETSYGNLIATKTATRLKAEKNLAKAMHARQVNDERIERLRLVRAEAAAGHPIRAAREFVASNGHLPWWRRWLSRFRRA